MGPIIGEAVLNDTNFERGFFVAGLLAFVSAGIALFAPARVAAESASFVMPARRSINIGIQRRVETASRYLPAFASKVADFDNSSRSSGSSSLFMPSRIRSRKLETAMKNSRIISTQ